MDNLTKAQRHKNMKHIRSKDTKIEIKLRKALWRKGYRYRKKFLQLKSEIRAGKWNAMVTMKADTIASDWKQFMDFMEVCEEEAT